MSMFAGSHPTSSLTSSAGVRPLRANEETTSTKSPTRLSPGPDEDLVHDTADCGVVAAGRAGTRGWTRLLGLDGKAAELLADHVDSATPQTMSGMHRAPALRITDDWRRNGKIVRRLREALQLALVLLVLEILVWMFAIAEPWA